MHASAISSIPFLLSCKASKGVQYSGCPLEIEGEEFIISYEYSRVLEFIEQKEVLIKNILIYKEYPNGIRGDNLTWLVNIETSEIYRYTGPEFELNSIFEIERDEMIDFKEKLDKLPQKNYNRDCMCCDGYDGVLVYFSNDDLQFGFRYTIIRPEFESTSTDVEEMVNDIVKSIRSFSADDI